MAAGQQAMSAGCIEARTTEQKSLHHPQEAPARDL